LKGQHWEEIFKKEWSSLSYNKILKSYNQLYWDEEGIVVVRLRIENVVRLTVERSKFVWKYYDPKNGDTLAKFKESFSPSDFGLNEQNEHIKSNIKFHSSISYKNSPLLDDHPMQNLVVIPEKYYGFVSSFIPLDLSFTEGALKPELYMSFDDKDMCDFFSRLQELGLWTEEIEHKGIPGFSYKPFAWTMKSYNEFVI